MYLYFAPLIYTSKPLEYNRTTNLRIADHAEVALQFMIWKAANSEVLINI